MHRFAFISGGSQKSSSKPVDMTPKAFADMQGPFASVLGNLLGFQQTAPQQPAAATPAAPTATPKSPISGSYGRSVPENTDFQRINAANTQALNPFVKAAQPQAQPQFTATGDTSDPLRGIPQYGGPLTAGITQNEQTILDQIMGLQSGQSGNSTARDFLNRVISGEFVPGQQTPGQVNDFVNGLDLGYTPDGSMSDFTAGLQGASKTGAFGGENPFMQSYIESAQRETNRALQETLSRTLPGRFTQAGQFVQPGSSSAFDRAAAIATEGAASAMGDIATDISYNAYEAAANREAEAMAQELERRGQFGEAARARQAAAKEAELARGQEDEQAALQRQQEAALALPGVNAQEIETAIQALQAQGLPRMIEDLGIERGLEQFNNRVNNLLTTLGITAGVTRPVVANTSSSSGSQIGIGNPFK